MNNNEPQLSRSESEITSALRIHEKARAKKYVVSFIYLHWQASAAGKDPQAIRRMNSLTHA